MRDTITDSHSFVKVRTDLGSSLPLGQFWDETFTNQGNQYGGISSLKSQFGRTGMPNSWTVKRNKLERDLSTMDDAKYNFYHGIKCISGGSRFKRYFNGRRESRANAVDRANANAVDRAATVDRANASNPAT
jgi:hypothetical protein